MASISIQSGTSSLFWDYLWLGKIPKQAYPELYSFTKKPNMTLASAKMSPPLIATFNLPLSVEAFKKFLGLEEIVHNFLPNPITPTVVFFPPPSYRHGHSSPPPYPDPATSFAVRSGGVTAASASLPSLPFPPLGLPASPKLFF